MNTTCQICKKDFDTKQLAYHIKRQHNVTYLNYLEKYWAQTPGYQLCEICGNIVKTRNKKTCSDKCYKNWQSKIGKGRILPKRTKEHCKKISEKAKERLRNPENHPLYGKHQSDEAKQKASRTQQERLKNPENHPMFGKHHTEKTREKISNTRKEKKIGWGASNGMFGKTHTPKQSKKSFLIEK